MWTSTKGPSADLYTRHRYILERLNSEGRVQVDALARLLGVSSMTIRRDLRELEERGLLKRVRGGAVVRLLPEDVGYQLRARRNRREKQTIAEAAGHLLEPGQVVYIDSGTTCTELARVLARRASSGLRLHVFTHAVNVASALAGIAGLTVHQIGGEIYRETYSAVGPLTLRTIMSLNFDLFFMGVCGVHPERGWTNTNFPEAEVKQVVMERAQRTLVLADASKWGRMAAAHIAPLGKVNAWIVEREPAPGVRDLCRGSGLQLFLAEELLNGEELIKEVR